MFLGIAYGFWLGMGVVAGITLVGCIVAWALPPKKATEQNNPKKAK